MSRVWAGTEGDGLDTNTLARFAATSRVPYTAAMDTNELEAIRLDWLATGKRWRTAVDAAAAKPDDVHLGELELDARETHAGKTDTYTRAKMAMILPRKIESLKVHDTRSKNLKAAQEKQAAELAAKEETA